MATGRIQRWALTLAGYDYSIQYCEEKNVANRDAHSRLPVKMLSEHEVPRHPESMVVKSDGATDEGKEKALDLLHEAHQGIVRMKFLARGYMWWPSMYKQIELTVRECLT